MDNKFRFQNCFRKLLRPYSRQVGLIVGLTVVQGLLQVLMALMSRYVIDAALERSQQLALWGVLLAVNVLALVGVHTVLSWLANSTADRFCAQMRQDIMGTAVYSDDGSLREQHSGVLLSKGIEDVRTVCDGAVSALPSLVGQVTRLAATFAAVVLIYPPVAGVLLLVAAVVGVTTACLRPAIKKRHRQVRAADEKVMATMQEDMQQLELIQSLDAQEMILSRFDRCQKDSLYARFKQRLWVVGSNSIINTASQVGSGAMLLWGAYRVAVSAMSYGSLTALLQLLALFRGPVLSLSGLWTRLATVEVAAERLDELLKQTNSQEENTPVTAIRQIVFENVTFCYPGEEQPVLEQFDLRIPMDNWSCLTGVSGKGKTTLFKLILGLHKPQQGRVYLQTDREQISCSAATRHLFAYVPQDYAMFSGTILENLRLVSPSAEEARLQQALSVAQATFVWDLSEKEQAVLGENNTGLSKGQLQRLAIARAVLMERPVLLLDECTSALDAGTEEAVLRNLHALGKQAILVTHRPEAVEKLANVTQVTMEQ